jgi:hypothetical protein
MNSAPSPVGASDGAVAILGNASQSRCLSQALSKAGATGSLADAGACASIDTLVVDSTEAIVSIVQHAYCSSKFMLSANDSSATLILCAIDTSTLVSRCSCPFRLTYSLKGAGIGSKKIVYRGISHPELNQPCTLTVKE